ncbi:MAG: SAM-dependent methyltransferase [Dermatophilaceae bacterium]
MTKQQSDDVNGDGPVSTAVTFWEDFYAGREQVWTGRANPVLVEVVTPLAPGRALDLGCGEGGDAVWLAEQGWHVTAVDISPVALRRVIDHARAAGVADQITVRRHELGVTFPEGQYDLVSAQFLQAPAEVRLDRDAVLRRATGAVAPGGLLLVVEHGAMPPWAGEHHAAHDFPTPQQTLAALALPADAWDLERSGAFEREASGPDGQRGMLVDNVIAARRR